MLPPVEAALTPPPTAPLTGVPMKHIIYCAENGTESWRQHLTRKFKDVSTSRRRHLRLKVHHTDRTERYYLKILSYTGQSLFAEQFPT